jgi:hypothetical protein
MENKIIWIYGGNMRKKFLIISLMCLIIIVLPHLAYAQDDYGDTRAEAVPIQLDSEVSGTMNSLEDKDYFYFNATQSGKYQITTAFKSSWSINFKKNIYKSNGDILALNVSNQIKLEANQKYYLEVLNELYFDDYNYYIIITYVGDDYGDDFQTADEIEVGQAVDGIYEMIGEKDYFKFNTSVEGKYIVECNDDKSLVGVYDQNGNYISGETYKLLSGNQTYFICVRDNKYQDPYPRSYSIKIYLETDDYVDNLYGALVIDNLEGGISGAINYYRDEDYMKFTVKETGDYVIEGTGDMGLTGDLYYGNGTWILSYGGSQNSQMKVYYKFEADKIYCVSVKGSYNTTGNYNVKLRRLIDDHGNNFSTATEVQVESEIQGIISNTGDIDLFSFVTSEPGYYIIDAKGPTYGYLYDSDQNIISTDLIGEGYFYMPITVNLDGNKQYYIRIAGNVYERPYNLSVKLIDDDYGNGISDAYTITDSGISGNIEIIGDEDYFAFTPQSEGLYVFKTSSNDGLIPTTYLYKSDGVQLEGKTSTLYDYSYRAEYSLKRDTKYYLKVFSNCGTYGKSHLLGHYNISIEKYADDVANIFEYATPLSLDSNYIGSIDYRGDTDIYSFTPETTGLFHISGKSVTGNGVLCEGYLYDNNGSIIDNDVSIMRYDFRIIKLLTGGEKYYIAVKNFLSSSSKEDVQTGKYILQVLSPITREDINDDLMINILDLIKESQHYNKKSDDSDWNESLDMNGDNIIDLLDLVRIAKKIQY